MPRTIATDMAGATLGIATPTGAVGVLLIELQFGSGTQYLTNAGTSFTWNTHTWVAVGGAIGVAGTQERWEPGASCRMSLSGVEQSLLAIILGLQYRGRLAIVRWAHLNVATGTLVADPLVLFSGLMNDAFDVSTQWDEQRGPSITIETRLTERVSDIGWVRGIRTNVHSHQATLLAAGVSAGGTDTFMQTVASIQNTRIFWNTEAPFTGTQPPVPPSPTIPGDPSPAPRPIAGTGILGPGSVGGVSTNP